MADIKLKDWGGNPQIYTGVSKIAVPNNSGGVEEYIKPAGTKSITENGTYDISEYKNVTVNSQGNMEVIDLGRYSNTNIKGTVIATLSSRAKSHREDTTFAITIIANTAETSDTYRVDYISASNKAFDLTSNPFMWYYGVGVMHNNNNPILRPVGNSLKTPFPTSMSSNTYYVYVDENGGIKISSSDTYINFKGNYKIIVTW